MLKLTPRQRLFALYYIQDPSATKAAKRAGYSEKTAKEMGYENLTKPHIQDFIRKHLDEVEATPIRIKAELAKIAFADIGDYVKVEQGGEVTITPFESLEPGATRAIKKVKEKRSISSGEDGDTVLHQQTEFEMYSKLDALNTLSKVWGMVGEQKPEDLQAHDASGVTPTDAMDEIRKHL